MSNKNPLLYDRLVSLRLPAELDDRLRELAEEQGITPSELHRRSLHLLLSGVAGFGEAEPKTDDANKDEA